VLSIEESGDEGVWEVLRVVVDHDTRERTLTDAKGPFIEIHVVTLLV
jgi:hypothetical protein